MDGFIEAVIGMLDGTGYSVSRADSRHYFFSSWRKSGYEPGEGPSLAIADGFNAACAVASGMRSVWAGERRRHGIGVYSPRAMIDERAEVYANNGVIMLASRGHGEASIDAAPFGIGTVVCSALANNPHINAVHFLPTPAGFSLGFTQTIASGSVDALLAHVRDVVMSHVPAEAVS